MTENGDRLYDLLPVYIRQRDALAGGPLRALLRVASEQVSAVESDISQLYKNWFIETCEDWAVPYIGDLVGYRLPSQTTMPGNGSDVEEQQRNRILIPRREVGNLIGYRRRKGTLALLELLANDVARWPARAVEFGRLLGVTQSLHHERLERGRTANMREGHLLDLAGSPFDLLPHSVDVRRIASVHSQGRYNIPNAGLFVFRIKPYPITRSEARCMEEEENAGDNCFTFSPLGNDTALFNSPVTDPEPKRFSGELNLPVPIRRRAFEERWPGKKHAIASANYYGRSKSLAIWAGKHVLDPVPCEHVIPADLSGWRYWPPSGLVAVDPELGRICFHPGEQPSDVIVSYYYGFSDELGGGEYPRPEFSLQNERLYTVSSGGAEARGLLRKALEQWKKEQPARAVIEITDSQTYDEDRLSMEIGSGKFLEIRAAQGARPVIRIIDTESGRAESISVTGMEGSSCVFDGVVLTGRGIQVKGKMADLVVRHCTLVPGWGLHQDGRPRHAAEPSISLLNTSVRVSVEHSILGGIRCEQRERKNEPQDVRITTSIVDATADEANALWSSESHAAYVKLDIVNSTVIGRMWVHQLELAENCIFTGDLRAARRQSGCVRFCYVAPRSLTPRRHHCQPDLVIGELTGEKRMAAELGMVPVFNSTRYGTPAYCQLAESCSEGIRKGAYDESEMGVFHDLYQPQRDAALSARLEEFIPAGSQVGIVLAS